ncbi:NADP-dependent isocitrate dehydrogenase [Oceanispirochaeta crateris]|uniref:Isocitrate dehydrogenase [NADP] n=1 Tax=Oceanispirochaeta crateris TaxID=2518645 RepID=A0A5C1QSR7_9SPIO|nr:NADP-dependent isocitrate dehydrogenase [Oceanispirochaeta crateris]QEN09646.1 NADP-dependent isocitrate dehydrogenase [Oceanispirochaeta crateris]
MASKIIYTVTDESPALATGSLLPIVRSFTKTAGIEIDVKNLSLAGRLLAAFPDYLTEDQRVSDDLKILGELVTHSHANIIKLPNISASVPQLLGALKELQSKGYNLPDYPENPANDQERVVKQRYDLIKGSAVNPVLREGNSDRRVPGAVKKYAQKHPHVMGEWSQDSKTHVVTMKGNDFYNTEKSVLISKPCSVHVELVSDKGETLLLKEEIALLEGEILDSAVMNISALRSFLAEEIKDAYDKDVLLSIQLKASMMKISDPIIFGHMISLYFEDVFTQYKSTLDHLGVNPDNGLGDLFTKLETLPTAEKNEILSAIEECSKKRPDLSMVDSSRGITSLHVPSDVLIDASIPSAIRNSGKMVGPDGKLKDVKMIIPDSSYAKIYQNTIEYSKQNGAFDPKTMGSVSNVGLMAQKAEEYGSHDKTFLIPSEGMVRVVDESGTLLMDQKVSKGDIFRMCQVKDAPIRDWVRLGVNRARATGAPAVFWLDENRPHDIKVIEKVKKYLPLEDIEGLDVRILSPGEATLYSLQRMKEGKDTISVTGNVLRDYLTDLFPILELGTSSKMLSIVSLLNGGVLFETGASGSAPMLVQQFIKEGHFQWNSLGEFLALTVSLEHFGTTYQNSKALILAEALEKATELYLENNRGPAEAVHEIDIRGSHFYLVLYWAQALAEQNRDEELKLKFAALSKELKEHEEEILEEFMQAQGHPVDLGGYYLPDPEMVSNGMRPCTIFNQLLASL